MKIKKVLIWSVLSVFALFGSAGSGFCSKITPSKGALEFQNTLVEAAKSVKPSVVSINVEVGAKKMTREFKDKKKKDNKSEKRFEFDGRNWQDFFERFFGEIPDQDGNNNEEQWNYSQPARGMGSGIIIKKEGYILTNYHVVKDASKIEVKLFDGTKHKAKLIGFDKRHDVAVVKIETKKEFPEASLGDSDKLEVGEIVLAVGSPYGYDYSVTMGTVSAKGRLFEKFDEDLKSQMPLRISQIIQTDAPINPGNSGGPLVNIYGEVIGINMAIISGGMLSMPGNIGIGFAIPINNIKALLDDMIKGKKITVGNPWLGVSLQELDEKLMGKFNVKNGALITKVMENSPASKAGFESGDVIVKIGEEDINDSSDAITAVSEYNVGDRVNITVSREGILKNFKVTLAEYGQEEAPEISESRVSEQSNKLGIEIKQAKSGVEITDVENDSLAQNAGVLRGDIIKEIDRLKINGLKDFYDGIKKADLKKGVLLLIERNGNTIYIVISSS